MTETTIANIAFRFGGALEEPYLTPRANCGLLQGVMRTELLEAGRIREGSVTIEQVKRAAQVRPSHRGSCSVQQQLTPEAAGRQDS